MSFHFIEKVKMSTLFVGARGWKGGLVWIEIRSCVSDSVQDASAVFNCTSTSSASKLPIL